MKEKYFSRDIEPFLKKALNQFPVVLITGPRQAGKSTLLKHFLSHYTYVTLDDPTLRALAISDPALFLSMHPTPLIIDEVQYAPTLLSFIKMKVDADRQNYGQYVLTGSQIFQLMAGVSETLAGRIALFHLYPLSWQEIEHIPGQRAVAKQDAKVTEQMITGFYPEFFKTPSLDPHLWFGSYVSTYLERDVRNIKAITNLSRFQTFLGLLASRVGNILNIAEVAKECGISQPTAKDWLTILQATYVIYLLKPYFNNHGKRLVKSPKLYFVDTGILCYLLGIDSVERFLKVQERGAIFENMVVMEALKRISNSGIPLELYFYRTVNGLEVDLIEKGAGVMRPFEIKFSKTIDMKMATSLQHFLNDFPDSKGKILSLRETPLPLKENISAIHWSDLAIS